ncbi:hypothetical protein EON81_09380 [bacterium]|nr:MAG: hypothetical protein EON81_09380 [bacterium]
MLVAKARDLSLDQFKEGSKYEMESVSILFVALVMESARKLAPVAVPDGIEGTKAAYSLAIDFLLQASEASIDALSADMYGRLGVAK